MTENAFQNNITRAGFIAIIGAPNAGKSTLVNALVGSKVSIVTHKVQTTRTQIRGIVEHGDAQLILVDTPGLFSPKRRLERAMVAAAKTGAMEADMVALLVDVSHPDVIARGEKLIKEICRQGDPRPHYLILNKIDAVERSQLLAIADGLAKAFDFADVFMVSALKKDGLAAMLDVWAATVPEGPALYEEGQVSDMPFKLSVAEITREQVFLNLHQELPYSITVETEALEYFDNGDIKISQLIYVAREAHKKIVLGKGGQGIRRIGQTARIEMERQFDCKVHLSLLVKVQENWADDKSRYALWGLDADS